MKDKRREVRLGAREDGLLVEAAGLAGVSVTDFLVDPAIERAEELVTDHRRIVLDEDAHARFLAALDAPFDEARAALADEVKRARPLKHVD